MKVPSGPGNRPIVPDPGSGDSKTPASPGSKTPSSSTDLPEAAKQLAKVTQSSVSRLMKAGGSAADFTTVGLKVLTQTAKEAIEPSGKKGNPPGSPAEQVWQNVGKSIFGPVEAIPAKVSDGVQQVARGVKEGAFDQAAEAMTDVAKQSPPRDVNSLVQHVLRNAYMENTQDLQFYAEKVKHFNDQKKRIRDQIQGLRKEAAGAAPPSIGDKDNFSDEIKKWEEQLRMVGDDAQLANVDLQNILQKQQQTMQTMSNVAKMLHDTAMAVVRKIGG